MKRIFTGARTPMPEEYRRFLRKSRLEKVKIISISILLMMLANDPECVEQYGHMVMPFAILVAAVAVTYLILSVVALKRSEISQKAVDVITISFWTVLAIGIIPFIILDAYIREFPINMTMILMCFIMMPITRRSNAFKAFGSFAVLSLILSAPAKPSVSYMLAIVVMTAMGYLFSRHIHGSYYELINKLTEETRTDFLTLVANRKGGFERARATLALCKRHKQICAFYMIDIDYFKDYNDTFGHYAGDNALISVAHTIQEVFARKSDIVFRYGGEEFAVCVSIDSIETIEKLAEELRNTIEKSMIEAGNKKVSDYLTVSVGATAYVPGETNEILDEAFMFSMADMALYEAKQKGRNQIVVKLTKS